MAKTAASTILKHKLFQKKVRKLGTKDICHKGNQQASYRHEWNPASLQHCPANFVLFEICFECQQNKTYELNSQMQDWYS